MSDPLDIHKNQVHQYWNFSLDLSQTMIDISPSKRAFEKFKPWGLFSEFYGSQGTNYIILKQSSERSNIFLVRDAPRSKIVFLFFVSVLSLTPLTVVTVDKSL